jgi:sortase A
MSMTKRGLLRFVVAFIGAAMIVAGVLSLAVGPGKEVQIILPPGVEVMGAEQLDEGDVAGVVAAENDLVAFADEQPAATETPQVKVASAVVSEASASLALQEATATPDPAAAAPAAAASDPQAVPTMDVTAAIKAFQNAYPIPQRIIISELKVNAKIQPVGPGKSVGANAVEWTAPNNRNVGWHDYSGRIGEGKNIVLNGHNNIYGAVFRKLYTLEAGDEIKLQAGDREVSYVVEEVMILKERGEPLDVRIQNAKYIQPMADDRLTIISCWPENNNTHRVVVIAKPASAAPAANTPEG